MFGCRFCPTSAIRHPPPAIQMRFTLPGLSLVAALGPLATPQQAPAQGPASFELDSTTVTGFRWRNIGPANMQGRVADVTGIPSPSKTMFVAAAAGGIWKSTNN